MRRLAALGCLLLTQGPTGCTGAPDPPTAEAKPARSELTVWFVNDLHLLSEELTDQSPEFLAMIARGDGKTAHYSQEIGQALVWQITSLPEEERPDMLLAAGDLTFNGEKLSHETVAGLFEEIEAAGVPVLTLPGNHDVNNGMAYRYTGNTAEPIETVTAQEFREIYRAYGWEDSLLRDTASMSYVWEPAEDLWIIAIDGNTDSHSGWVDDETLSWLDKVLTQAEEEGKAVLTFSHQNLVRHNARFPFGYTFGNAMTVRELMADHGVNLNLSGHIHIQHIGALQSRPAGLLNIQPGLLPGEQHAHHGREARCHGRFRGGPGADARGSRGIQSAVLHRTDGGLPGGAGGAAGVCPLE